MGKESVNERNAWEKRIISARWYKRQQKTPTAQSGLLRRYNCTSASPKSKDKRMNLITCDSKRISWYWIRWIPDSSETQVHKKAKSLTGKGYFCCDYSSCIWKRQRNACSDHNFSKGNNCAASPFFSRLLFLVVISSFFFSNWRFWGQEMATFPTTVSVLGPPSSSEENPAPFCVSGADGSVWKKQAWKLKSCPRNHPF